MNGSLLPTAPPSDSFIEAPPPYSTLAPHSSIHSSPFSSPANRNAPSYHLGNTKLCHIDFLPRLIKKKIFGKDQYEAFSDLMLRVNLWLADHIDSHILNIESVTWFDVSEKNIFTDDASLYKSNVNGYLRGLRLWYMMPLVPLVGSSDKQQIIHCITHPHKTSQSVTQLFHDFNSAISKSKPGLTVCPEGGASEGGGGGGGSEGGGGGGVDGHAGSDIESHLKNIPKGRIVSIETVGVACVDGLLETEDTHSRLVTGETRYVFMALRVYILQEMGTPTEGYETIEFQDFIPGRTNSNKENRGYELFSDVMDRAARWVIRRSQVRFLNVQSIEVKLKKDIPTPERGRFKDHCSNFLKVTRSYFVVKHGDPLSTNQLQETRLSCRTFKPRLTNQATKNPHHFENMRCIMERVNRWIQLTGARVYSAETLLVQCNNQLGSEATVLANRDANNQMGRYVFQVRLYLNGDYNETPSSTALIG